MTDASHAWASKVREIANAVKQWEARDVRDQIERGDGRLHRPAFFADLQELADALEGRSARFAASIHAKQNWPRTVRDFNRDWEIAALIHQHRLTGKRGAVQRGKAEAENLPGATRDIVDEADKRYRRYFIDGTAEHLRFGLMLRAARYPVAVSRNGGKI